MMRALAIAMACATPSVALASGFTIVHQFAGQAADGNAPNSLTVDGSVVYGTTEAGGSTQCPIVQVVGCGIVFSVDTRTGLERTVLALDPRGQFPSSVNVAGPNLLVPSVFGNTLISISIKSPKERVLAGFGGSAGNGPNGPVAYRAGVAAVAAGYGGATGTCPHNANGGCGAISTVNTRSGKILASYDFAKPSHGENPYGIIAGSGSVAFGATYFGGASPTGCPNSGNLGCGLVYSFDTKTNKETVLYAFHGGADGGNPTTLVRVGGIIYGLTSTTVFSLDPATRAFKTLYTFNGGQTGYGPTTLTTDGTLLYGTTFNGGARGNGTLWSIDPATAAEKVLYSFDSPSVDGSMPSALVYAGGALYGTMQLNGPSIYGLVYKFAP